MRSLFARVHIGIIVVCTTPTLPAQVSQPNVLEAHRIETGIRLDGVLDEQAWQQADKISNFTQRELHEGQPASERTEVAILYNESTLYIGVWCYDGEPDKLTAQKMQRDFDFDTEDNFKIIIDTYRDRRNGYLFVTNPNAALFDALVLDNGQQVNETWDGVWDAAAERTKEGWFAEIAIPFSTLKFSSEQKQVWGINFERNIRRKREQVLWQGWSRDARLEQVARAGTLVGLHGISSVRLFEVKPYALGGAQMPRGLDNQRVGDLGGDLNYLITPTLKLNLTVNPDFAQVESDREQVNLTRFSLFFPEKREFFLEGQNQFSFNMGSNIRPFYSRRIGISPQRTEIPILGGARLLGKINRTTLGALSMQTAEEGAIPSSNFSVLRWKQDVLQESSIGLIGISKQQPGRWNATYGADFLYATSSLFGDKNFSLGGAFVQSYTSDASAKTGSAHRIIVRYPNDFIEWDAWWERVGKSFNPEVGFLLRENYQRFFTELDFKPRPKFLPFVNQMEFQPLEIDLYTDAETGDLVSFNGEVVPLGVSATSGDFFEFNIQPIAEKLSEPFEIQEGVVIPVDEYWFTRYEIQFATFSGRSFAVAGEVNWGGFFDGSRTKLEVEFTWRPSKYLSLSADYQRNDVDLPAGDFVVDEVGGRADFAFSPRLFGSIFGQWNNEDEEVLLNFRINWIPRPGADLFFVFNQSVDTLDPSWVVSNTTVLSKFVWRFVL